MTFAQFVGDGSSGIIGAMNTVVVPIIFTLSAAAFIWGVANYFFLHGSEEAKREEGKQFVLWGIIGLVVLFAVWSFVNIVLSTLRIAPGA